MKIVEAEYIVVKNDTERDEAEEYFKDKKVFMHHLNYPYSIGKEGSFLFYTEELNIEDYVDRDTNTKYVYKSLTL